MKVLKTLVAMAALSLTLTGVAGAQEESNQVIPTAKQQVTSERMTVEYGTVEIGKIESGNVGGNVGIQAVIANEVGAFSGTLDTRFYYSKGDLRVYVENRGSKQFKFVLTAPTGSVIWSTTVSPGTNQQATFYRDPVNPVNIIPGEFKCKFSNDDGGTSPYTLTARDDL